MKRWLALLLAAPLLLLSFFALRLAFADYLYRSGIPENVQRAARMFPSNPHYQAKAGNLKRSLELNPNQAAGWIELASEEESKGEFPAAEGHLLRAAEVDATFEPRWALANYYFRRDQRGEFWKWLRLAAERSYGDRAALFQLAWRSGASSGEILKRWDGLGEVLGRYVEWLSKQNRWEVAGEASLALIKAGAKAEAPAVLEVCDQLVAKGQTELAAPVWNAMVASGWIASGALRGELKPGVLTNAKWEWKPTGKGFDWRLPWRAGLEHHWRPGELTIALDGRQEEKTELLEQVVPVQGGKTYELRYRYRAEGLAKNGGVRWRVAGGAEAGDPLMSGEWQEGRFRFRAPEGVRQMRLVLGYERQPGSSRPEATILLDGSLELTGGRQVAEARPGGDR